VTENAFILQFEAKVSPVSVYMTMENK
jgi:hypothetical protein